MTVAWYLVPGLDTALQQHGNIKAKPKRIFSSNTVYFFYSPQNKHGLVAAQRCNTQEHQCISNFRGCKYRIELNTSFPSLEDEEVTKWGKVSWFFSLALVCSPFKFDRKIRGHCFCFLWYMSNAACVHSLCVQIQFCTGILKHGTCLGCDFTGKVCILIQVLWCHYLLQRKVRVDHSQRRSGRNYLV